MSALIAALTDKHGLPTVDAGSIDALLAPAAGEPEHVLVFFSGDPAERTDSTDVAVVLPELLSAFAGRLRGAVVDRAAEASLRPRFHVDVVPSLVLLRRATVLDVLPRIRDWSDYVARIGAALAPDAPAHVATARVDVTRNMKRSDA